MKISYITLFMLIPLSISFQYCKNATTVNNNDESKSKVEIFKSPDEAALKAKEDLLTVLRTTKEINLGLEIASLEKSVPENPYNYFMLDFSKLLQAEPGTSFNDLVGSQKSVLVPLVADNKITTVVELAYENKQYSISTLGNKLLTQELSALTNILSDTSGSVITIYEVPNLHKIIYRVTGKGTENFYTNYGDRLSIERSISKEQLLPLLSEDAKKFQEQFGEQLKSQKLVK